MSLRISDTPVRRLRPVAAAAAVVAASLLMLSACAPSTGVAVKHTIRPHHSASSSSSTPTPTPTPTPTVAAVTPPKVRIPLSCGQLVPGSQLNSDLGTTLSSTAPSTDVTSPGVDPDLSKYLAIQAGALDCSWTSPVPSGGNADATYDVMVIPDATAAWNTYAAKIHQYYSVKNPLGANSWSACWVATGTDVSKNENCGVDVLIGSTWINVGAYTDKYSTTPTEAQAFTRFQPLFQATINAVKATTVSEPAWTDPLATSLTLPADGSAVSNSGLSGAIGMAFGYDAAGFGPMGAATVNTALSAVLQDVNYHAQTGGVAAASSGNLELSVQVLPSGAWAYPALQSASTGASEYSVLSGIGTAAFMYKDGYGDPNGIVIVGTAGQHLYTIAVSDSGASGTPNPVTVGKAAATYVVSQLGG